MTEYNLTGLSQVRGCMFRELDHGDRFAFEFEDTQKRLIHTWFVSSNLKIECLVDTDTIERFALSPWSYRVCKPCNKIIETVI